MRKTKIQMTNDRFVTAINGVRWGKAISNKLLSNPNLKKGGDLETLFTELAQRMDESEKALDELAVELGVENY
jgi:hypothetical protein